MPAVAFIEFLTSRFTPDEIVFFLCMLQARSEGKELSIVLVPAATTRSKL